MYKAMAADSDISLKVIYFSDETVKEFRDNQFGVNIKWDIPLLEGYESIFIKNNSWKPSINNGFFGLVNFGIVKELRERERSIVVVHGWAFFSNLLAIWVARFYGHTVCLRGESPAKHELKRSNLKQWGRWLFFKIFLFPRITKFLFIGDQNRSFYKQWGVRDERLIFTPYSVDNDRFRSDFTILSSQRNELRSKIGAFDKTHIVLFSGKFIPKKRPMDLLKAVVKISNPDLIVIMMGDGLLRTDMERFIDENKLQSNVIITGFVNQTEISKYYVMADAFVMCSEAGETWGLSMNEAMNFNLPIISSDMTGSSDDLVKIEQNGFIFRTGDIDQLTECIGKIVSASDGKRKAMGIVSSQIVSGYSYQTIIDNLKKTFA
jgi:glycosyltransferase involved in cell wall biosynthesis